MDLRNIVSNVAGSIPKVKEFLKDINFPAGKQTIIDKAREKGADNTIISLLQKLPDKQFQSQSEVVDELGKAK